MEKKEPPKNDEVAPQEIARGDLIKIHKIEQLNEKASQNIKSPEHGSGVKPFEYDILEFRTEIWGFRFTQGRRHTTPIAAPHVVMHAAADLAA
uniref:Uncharacterized protein n=1 Tax=Aegilops tauschii TaxID=37682 RepID=R7W862_AEGTA